MCEIRLTPIEARLEASLGFKHPLHWRPSTISSQGSTRGLEAGASCFNAGKAEDEDQCLTELFVLNWMLFREWLLNTVAAPWS